MSPTVSVGPLLPAGIYWLPFVHPTTKQPCVVVVNAAGEAIGGPSYVPDGVDPIDHADRLVIENEAAR
jgi:hypothetical protein